MCDRGQTWPVPLSMRAARLASTGNGSTSATAFATVSSAGPEALGESEQCGIQLPGS